MQDEFWGRIKFEGKLEDISRIVCKEFALGKFISNKLVLTGYEDFNFILKTNKGRYFVKVFANTRDIKECKRIIDIMSKVIAAKVSTPKLFKSKSGYLFVDRKAALRLCVMEYIDGKDFYNSKKSPTIEQIKDIAMNAAKINSLNIKPYPVYDRWAIVYFKKEFKRKSRYLKPEDLKSLKPLLKAFDELKIETLPHAFVHGDIRCGNVVQDKNRLWIVDFSVSNYYPRINELSVMACSIFFNEHNTEISQKNIDFAVTEYQKVLPLTKRELQGLPIFIKLAHAMQILLASYYKYGKKIKSKESEYFLNQGRVGLKQMSELYP